MRRVLVLWLCLVQAPLFAGDACSLKNEQCLRVVEDYRGWVGLLKVRNRTVEEQRDEALKQASKEEGRFPGYFWLVMGVFVGASAAVLLK